MKPRDFLLMMLVCLIWALNVVISKVVLSDFGIPPLYYAALRFALVALVLLPLLRPLPMPFAQVALAAILLGGAHFGLLFVGLRSVSPSIAAIILQMSAPFSALLAVLVLREMTTLARAGGIAIAFLGVVVTLYQGGGLVLDALGVGCLLVSALSLALGSILLKRLPGLAPLRLQAWVGLMSCAPLAGLSLLFEDQQIALSLAAGWPFALAMVFSVLVVTIGAHTMFFWVLQRYHVGVVAPTTLAMPIMTVAMGVGLLGDVLSPRMALGMAIALLGIAMVQWARPPDAAAR